MNRRQVLVGGTLFGMTAGGVLSALAAPPADARRIEFVNLHTEERLSTTFWRDGAYDDKALASIQTVLRDYRTEERHAIDPKLLDLLAEVAQSLNLPARFSVISGYRSPQTNAMLHEKSSGVSQHSLHMQGRAIDVRLAGIDCERLAARAIELQLGGVGYYKASNFVHLDTGAFRTWRG